MTNETKTGRDKKTAYVMGIEKYKADIRQANQDLRDCPDVGNYERVIYMETVELAELRIRQNRRRIKYLIEGQEMAPLQR